MEEFCSREVEAFGRDADHLQIMSVCSSFCVHLKVVCLQDPDAHKESNAKKTQRISLCDIVSFNPDGAFLEIAPLCTVPAVLTFCKFTIHNNDVYPALMTWTRSDLRASMRMNHVNKKFCVAPHMRRCRSPTTACRR